MKRVIVYGVTGAGKSTLARRIAEAAGLPYHAVDDLTWEPGWVAVPEEEQRNRIARICAGDEWVLDHMYGSWRDVPLARADLVVGLDFPRWRSLGRLLRRTARRIVLRTEICNGNRERLSMALSRDGIVAWHFQSYARKRDRMRAWAADPAPPEVVLLHSPAEVERWLAAWGTSR